MVTNFGSNAMGLPAGTFPYRWPAVAHITPFTYRDGVTYLELLEEYRQYLINLTPQFDKLLDDIVKALEAAIANAEKWAEDHYNDFTQHINDLVAEINNRVGPTDVKHFTVNGKTDLPFSDLWPNNHIIWYEATIGEDYDPQVVLPSNVTGSLPLPTEPDDTAKFALWPNGDGTFQLLTLDQVMNKTWNDQGAFRQSLDSYYAKLSDLANFKTEVNGKLATINNVLDGLDDRFEPYYYYVKHMGAVGDGVHDDTDAIQNALNLIRDGGSFVNGQGVIVLEPGSVYKVTRELNIYKNTRIEGNDAEIRRFHAGYLLLNGDRGAQYPAYTGHGNITLNDVILNSNAPTYNGVGSTLCMGHASGLTFNRVTVRNATSHGAEINASRIVTFTDCRFEGYVGSDNYVEAIQLDQATSWGFSAFGPSDRTATHHVIVDRCYFGPSETNAAWNRGVGAHGSIVDRPSNYITIRDCTFDSLKSCALRPYNWNHVVVSGCWSNSTDGFAIINTPIPSDEGSGNTEDSEGHQTGQSVNMYDFKFTNNTQKGGARGIRFVGQSTGRIADVVADGNYFNGNGSGVALDGYNVDNMLFSNNIIRNYDHGISFYATARDYHFNILGNTIKNCSSFGIYLSNVIQAVINGNSVYNSGFNNDWGASIRVAGDYSNVSVMGNTVWAASSDSRGKYGIYFTTTGGNSTCVGNTVYNGYTVAGVTLQGNTGGYNVE